MTTPNLTLLRTFTPTAGSAISMDAPPHPDTGLIRAYILRVTGTISATVAATPSWDEWKTVIFATLFPQFQLFAPRYAAQLCSANLDGYYWSELFEEKYRRAMPVEVNNVSVDDRKTVQIGTTAVPFQFDFCIPFEEPALKADRLWTCPPASLFRGDVTLTANFTAATGTVTLGGTSTVVSIASVNYRWLCATSLGDNARLPVIHRFEKRTISADTFEVGSGFMMMVKDARPPDGTVAYDLNIDGVNVNNGKLEAEDAMALYQMQRAGRGPESNINTPLRYIIDDCTVNELEYVQRSFSIRTYGASSTTLLLHIIESGNANVQRNLKAALGIPANAETVAVPSSPNNAPLGNVVAKVATNGARTLMLRGSQSFEPATARIPKTVPTIPPGTVGVGIASKF